MTADIILDHALQDRRVIIDTNFTSVFGASQHREAVLKSGSIYQLYTYLRSQERQDDPRSLAASGMFIHPSVDGDVDETVRIQGHPVCHGRFDAAHGIHHRALACLRALVDCCSVALAVGPSCSAFRLRAMPCELTTEADVRSGPHAAAPSLAGATDGFKRSRCAESWMNI